MYKEIEVEVIGFDKKPTLRTIPLDNINYYRPWTETSSEIGPGNDKLMTMVYLKNSIKGLKVNCSYEDFKNKIKESQN